MICISNGLAVVDVYDINLIPAMVASALIGARREQLGHKVQEECRAQSTRKPDSESSRVRCSWWNHVVDRLFEPLHDERLNAGPAVDEASDGEVSLASLAFDA